MSYNQNRGYASATGDFVSGGEQSFIDSLQWNSRISPFILKEQYRYALTNFVGTRQTTREYITMVTNISEP